METKNFGKLLKQLRKERNISQNALAKTAHLSASYPSYLEQGKKTPSKETVTALADALALDSENKQRFFEAAGYFHSTLSTSAISVSPVEDQPSDDLELESPYGTMHPESKFYIEREADGECQHHIAKTKATTVFIPAPRQTGKSSLMRRILAWTEKKLDKRSAFIDFQKIPKRYFSDEESFLIEFCSMISEQFDIPDATEQYWQGKRTNISKCSSYLSRHIIPTLNGPFILAMDEIEGMVFSPFRANFFGMLRTWHNDRAYDKNFAQMTLFFSSSIGPHRLIDNPKQSPFNVAIPILLRDFTLAEVEDLNRRHQSPLSQSQVRQLTDLVGGHPFLTRLALYQLAIKNIDMDTLLAQATEDTGPFDDHLRHYFRRVSEKPELKQVLIRIASHSADYEEDGVFHDLKELGLIKQIGQQVMLSNNLYARYFKERFSIVD